MGVTTKDAAILRRIGCIGTGRVTIDDSRMDRRTFEWIGETECKAKGIKIYAPRDTGDISALVYPPIGLDHEDLVEFLQKCRVNESEFGNNGTKTLKQFSEELVTGAATLVKNQDGSVLRKVDIVVLKGIRKDGRLLIETEEDIGGVRKASNRFPAIKRRSDENQFLAAHRCLRTYLNLDENQVEIDVNSVQTVDAESDSRDYPQGIRTQYRKRIITCRALV